MSRALTPEDRPDSPPPPAPCNLMAFAAFAAAAVLFVLYFCIRYTQQFSGSASHALFGLWGVYWLTGLAWGALRIRPREHKTGLFNTLMWTTVPQAFYFVVLWGALLMETTKPDVGHIAAIAFFGGPVIAVAVAFWSRRGLVFVLAQFFGPVGYALLVLLGG